MIQPPEMKETRPITVHDGGVSTTTEVWNMLSASFDGDLGRVSTLVQGSPGLLTCQYDYTSPLHLAVREGHVDLVAFLIERGALDPWGHVAMVKLLLESGADPNKSGALWSTPLAWARRKNYAEVERVLFEL